MKHDCNFKLGQQKEQFDVFLTFSKAQQTIKSMFSSPKLRRIDCLSAKYDELFN